MSDPDLMAPMHQRSILGRKGRPTIPITILEIRDLTQAEFLMLGEEGATTGAMAPLMKLRSSHHRVAQLLAKGRKNVEVSLITGYSCGRIIQLLQDPSFQELVSHYKVQQEAIFVDVQERLAQLGLSALDELKERVEEKPESVSTGQLLDIMDSAFERSVAPQKKGAQEVNIKMSWAEMVLEAHHKGKTIEQIAGPVTEVIPSD